MMHRFVMLAAAAVLLAACTSSDGPGADTANTSGTGATAAGPTSSNGDDGRIVFVREGPDESSARVFAIEPDGTGETQLIDRAAVNPVWSPEGSRLAFECLDGDLVRVCMANADGSNPRMLTQDATDTVDPTDNFAPRAWSPDGERLALVGFGGAPSGIFTMAASDRGALTRVTTSPTGHFDDTLALSPDGSKIVFVRVPETDDHDGDVFVVAADGTDLLRLSPPGTAVECCAPPDWSPDGSRVVFAGENRQEDWAIYSVDADGSDRQRISPLDGWAFAPSWSPDGRMVSFSQSCSTARRSSSSARTGRVWSSSPNGGTASVPGIPCGRPMARSSCSSTATVGR
jgi:Tol biopolymer transport system component